MLVRDTAPQTASTSNGWVRTVLTPAGSVPVRSVRTHTRIALGQLAAATVTQASGSGNHAELVVGTVDSSAIIAVAPSLVKNILN